MSDRELMQQALEALERCVATCFDQRAHEEVMSKPEHFVNQSIAALRERLVQPEQEPVATVESKTGNPDILMSWWHEPALPVGTKLYTAPPRREWVGLTDEVDALAREMVKGDKSVNWLARAIEAKLKEKNSAQ